MVYAFQKPLVFPALLGFDVQTSAGSLSSFLELQKHWFFLSISPILFQGAQSSVLYVQMELHLMPMTKSKKVDYINCFRKTYLFSSDSFGFSHLGSFVINHRLLSLLVGFSLLCNFLRKVWISAKRHCNNTTIINQLKIQTKLTKTFMVNSHLIIM